MSYLTNLEISKIVIVTIMAHILDLRHRNSSLTFLSSLYLWLSSSHFCYISFLLDFAPKIFPSSYYLELQVLKIDEYRERIGIFLFPLASVEIPGESLTCPD